MSSSGGRRWPLSCRAGYDNKTNWRQRLFLFFLFLGTCFCFNLKNLPSFTFRKQHGILTPAVGGILISLFPGSLISCYPQMRVYDFSLDNYNTESRKNTEKETSSPFDLQGIREHRFDPPNLFIFSLPYLH